MNLAKVTQRVFCLYFVMQIAINLAEVRQVAGGTKKVLCCFKIWVLPLTEYSKPVMAEHCRGNTYGYHMTWLKQLSTWLWGCFFSCYRLKEEKQNHFSRYSIDSGLASTEGYNMVWTRPKTLYTSNSRESLHLILRSSFVMVCVQLCVHYLYMRLCLYIYLNNNFKMYLLGESHENRPAVQASRSIILLLIKWSNNRTYLALSLSKNTMRTDAEKISM